MKSKLIYTILTVLLTSAVSTSIATAQSQTTPATKTQATTPDKAALAHDKAVMANDPNHVLATAYHQYMLVFSKALHGQAVGTTPVNVEFARTAVTEMRRGFDMMKDCNNDYMKTISAEVRANTAPMVQELETHRTDLNVSLKALEKEVALDVPDGKKIATLTTDLQTHLDAMAQLADTNPASKMTMKK